VCTWDVEERVSGALGEGWMTLSTYEKDKREDKENSIKYT